MALLLAGSPASAQPPQPAPDAVPLEVTYLANEGFLVEAGGVRVLIDALFGSEVTGYPMVPDTMRSRLERAKGEFSGVSVALATHVHRDHFDPAAVARFLTADSEALFVSTPQAAARFKSEAPDAESLLPRFRGVLPAPGEAELLEVGDVRVRALNLHHGDRVPPVDNLGFLVTLGGQSFFHFGDTEAKLEDFRPYLDLLRDTDVALLPFWFLASDWRAEMVRDQIRPGSIVVAHMPVPTAEAGYFGRWRSYDNLVRVMLDAFPKARIPRGSGERYRFDPR